eukprot:2597_1
MNTKDELLVFGYIHQMEREHMQIRIPEPLILLFGFFYVDPAEWDETLKSDDITILDGCIRSADDIRSDYWRSIFGKRICTESGKYEWNFEIIDSFQSSNMFNSWRLFIGIMEIEFCEKHLQEDCIYKNESIGFVCSQSTLASGMDEIPYGEKFEKKGHKLKMILDLDNLSLSYTINGNDYDNALATDSTGFTLNKTDKYKLAVCICPDTTLKMCS